MGTIDAKNITDPNSQNSRRLNFVVSPKQKKFDAAPFSFQLQARLMRLFHKKELHVIIARSTEEAVTELIAILKKKNATIGNLVRQSYYWQRKIAFEVERDLITNHS
jgi:hypothetical protein